MAEAFRWYHQAATLGHAKSINIIGRFYEEGWVVTADFERAVDLYYTAAKKGDFRGQFNYARILINAGHPDDALFWLDLIPATATSQFTQDLYRWLKNTPQPILHTWVERMLAPLIE